MAATIFDATRGEKPMSPMEAMMLQQLALRQLGPQPRARTRGEGISSIGQSLAGAMNRYSGRRGMSAGLDHFGAPGKGGLIGGMYMGPAAGGASDPAGAPGVPGAGVGVWVPPQPQRAPRALPQPLRGQAGVGCPRR